MHTSEKSDNRSYGADKHAAAMTLTTCMTLSKKHHRWTMNYITGQWTVILVAGFPSLPSVLMI